MLAQGKVTESDYIHSQWVSVRIRPVFAVAGVFILGGAVFVVVMSHNLFLLLFLVFFELFTWIYLVGPKEILAYTKHYLNLSRWK